MGETHVHISNTNVKPRAADGSAMYCGVRVGDRQAFLFPLFLVIQSFYSLGMIFLQLTPLYLSCYGKFNLQMQPPVKVSGNRKMLRRGSKVQAFSRSHVKFLVC